MNTTAPSIEPGFYRHYKHDPAGEFSKYHYEVIGLARHTEDAGYLVLYRPLYKNAWLAPAEYCARPYEMFIGSVEKDGHSMPRFSKVTDPDDIARLAKITQEMYPS